MAGNVLVGGLIGIAVDSVSGAYNSLYPNPVSVHLVPRGKSGAEADKHGPSSTTKSTSPAPKTSATPE